MATHAHSAPNLNSDERAPTNEGVAIDPFAFWPDRASTVAALRPNGSDPGHNPAYLFHTAYRLLDPGPTRLTLHLHGLRASRGTLVLRIHADPFDGGRVRLVAKHRVSLARVARQGGTVSLAFTARRECFHAIMGRIEGAHDATADALTLQLDPGPVEPTNRRALVAARQAVFGRGSLVERRPWRRSPVDRRGLVSTEPATLADPASQCCTERQLDEPAYAAWLAALGETQNRHLKQWEVLYALAVLRAHGMIGPGRRGVGFGCGTEWLPAYLAGQGCEVVATDMPADHENAGAWRDTGQYSDTREQLFFPRFIDREGFDRRVRCRPVDMNALPADLTGFDFSWSLCAFEHMGSIRQGLDFIQPR